MRFEPTGFPGDVGEEEDEDDEPEHPASASVYKARKLINTVLIDSQVPAQMLLSHYPRKSVSIPW